MADHLHRGGVSGSQAKQSRLDAQGGRCAYCQKPITIEPDDLDALATWDEVIPRARGGRADRWNRVLACLPCNARKANRDVRDFLPGWAPDPLWNLVELPPATPAASLAPGVADPDGASAFIVEH